MNAHKYVRYRKFYRNLFSTTQEKCHRICSPFNTSNRFHLGLDQKLSFSNTPTWLRSIIFALIFFYHVNLLLQFRYKLVLSKSMRQQKEKRSDEQQNRTLINSKIASTSTNIIQFMRIWYHVNSSELYFIYCNFRRWNRILTKNAKFWNFIEILHHFPSTTGTS